MAKQTITTREKDYSQWYLDIVKEADLSDYSPVRGCMVIKPVGYAIWEMIQQELDRRIKATGHVNAYFPLFIPVSFLTKEAQHVEGFAPEVAVVTHHRLESDGKGGLVPAAPLDEPLVVRPTSEAIIGDSFSRWVQSWRDLPLLINQWANVVRWEMRTRPFLRTAEFLWQEGHTAHATHDEAEEETLKILHEVYGDFLENVMAIPVFKGQKTEKEKFAGALRTYAIEAMMQDGKALQAGTSHNLGQNFAKAFEIKFQGQNQNEIEYAWTTSWGVSTRLIGALIMAHSDDDGLVLPPRLAPIQAVIVPIYKTDEEKAATLAAADQLKAAIGERARVKIDSRDNLTPGFKFNEWEVKGIPVRIEIGPRDVANQTVVLGRRDRPGKEGKRFVSWAELPDVLPALLEEIQAALYDRAKAFRDAHVTDVANYDELTAAVETGFARAWWAGSREDEDKIQLELKATIRCIPLEQDQPGGEGVCVFTGQPATLQVLFARSY
ncbi:proline--tRNA ligase [Armatimonas sp.]|uniref:proline--tRNA ligase n=1 Tax=Armatimonas sp. TaxID=1872638 RepID=UPI0037522926